MKLLVHKITGHAIGVNHDEIDQYEGYEELVPYPTEEEINDPEFQRLWKALQYFVIECDEIDTPVQCTYNHIKMILDQMNED